MSFLRKNKYGIAILGILAAIIGVFLKFLTVSAYGFSDSLNYIDSTDGKVVLGILLFTAVIIFIKKIKAISFISLLLSFGIIIYDAFFNVSEEIKTLKTLGVDVSFGIGFYLLVIGILIAFIFLFFRDDIDSTNANVNYNQNIQPPNEFNRMYAQSQRENMYNQPQFNNQMQQPGPVNNMNFNSQGFSQGQMQPGSMNNMNFNQQGQQSQFFPNNNQN